MTDTCHWGGAHYGWLTPEHLRDCDDHACQGCRPCPKTHCAMRGKCSRHVDSAAGIITCPSCIGKTRRDLAVIVDLYAVALPDEAVESGVDSEALNLIGPAALPFATDYRQGWCEFPRRQDAQHPYSTLGKWDLALRETYGPATDLRITVSRAADYLTGLLAGTFPHIREFEEFAREVASCRMYLEAVIHDSRTPEKGRPCPRCAEVAEDGKGPRLQKRWAAGDDEHTKRGDNDTWHCPDEPAHWWTERDYRDKVEADYEQHAEKLTASAITRVYGVAEGTVRQWAAREKVRKRGTDQAGRMLYDVGDVVCMKAGKVEA